MAIPLRTTASQGFTVRLGPPYYFGAGDTLVFELGRLTRDTLALRPVLELLDIDDASIRYEHYQPIAGEEAKERLAHP